MPRGVTGMEIQCRFRTQSRARHGEGPALGNSVETLFAPVNRSHASLSSLTFRRVRVVFKVALVKVVSNGGQTRLRDLLVSAVRCAFLATRQYGDPFASLTEKE